MKQEIKNSAAALGSVGTIGGFIADVLTPLGPFTKWLFIIFCILTFSLFIIRNKNIGKKYLTSSLIMSLIFGSLYFINGDSEKGVLSDNIDGISKIQSSLFNLQKSVDRVENKVDIIDNKIDLGFEKIEELIKSNNPINNPKTRNWF